jgi:hypothetical protein
LAVPVALGWLVSVAAGREESGLRLVAELFESLGCSACGWTGESRSSCAVTEDDVMQGRVFEVAIDANDPARVRPFWTAALDYVEHVTDDGAVDLVDPAGRGATIWFQRVPESKSVKNRLHLDIKASPAQRVALIERLTAVGGVVISSYPRFTVLADPEGNEVCLTDGQTERPLGEPLSPVSGGRFRAEDRRVGDWCDTETAD